MITMKVAGCKDEYASSLKLDSQIPQRTRRIKAGCDDEGHRRDDDKGGGGAHLVKHGKTRETLTRPFGCHVQVHAVVIGSSAVRSRTYGRLLSTLITDDPCTDEEITRPKSSERLRRPKRARKDRLCPESDSSR
ncbi:hypothetical protein Bca52824_035446 [Brassica carinata]|uniref:Uncharacterized protein n=1 Tax=Brassica carinata TaxID=52824 RepID=A0A8X7S7K3_BRACI|nr:hypothetical protein Bca52824_035446 [Brassica carinata]